LSTEIPFVCAAIYNLLTSYSQFYDISDAFMR